MRIWIVMVGEALPTDGKNVRLRRVATLCNLCAARGHDVTWWTSTFNHARKQQRAKADKCVITSEGVKLEMLYAPAYKRNISVGRLVNHYFLGKALIRRIKSEPAPDVILSAWPTIELSAASVEYGRSRGIPVIIDVRDLWPDIFVDVAPARLRSIIKLLLHSLTKRAKYVFQNCDGILGISPGYLRWALGYAARPQGPLDRVFPLGYDKPIPSEAELMRAEHELNSFGIDRTKLICWFVGVFGATYDLATVIKAARMLEERGENGFQFVLSGGGEKEPQWKKQAAGLKNVIFTGWVDGAKICCLGQMAHIGLAAYAASAPQGLPNKLFEYMAFGLPVLSSLSGEAQLFLNEHRCGLTYKAGDPESLINSVMALQSGASVRREYGANGLQLYEKVYSADKVYAAMADYLEAVASHKNREAAEVTTV